MTFTYHHCIISYLNSICLAPHYTESRLGQKDRNSKWYPIQGSSVPYSSLSNGQTPMSELSRHPSVHLITKTRLTWFSIVALRSGQACIWKEVSTHFILILYGTKVRDEKKLYEKSYDIMHHSYEQMSQLRSQQNEAIACRLHSILSRSRSGGLCIWENRESWTVVFGIEDRKRNKPGRKYERSHKFTPKRTQACNTPEVHEVKSNLITFSSGMTWAVDELNPVSHFGQLNSDSPNKSKL